MTIADRFPDLFRGEVAEQRLQGLTFEQLGAHVVELVTYLIHDAPSVKHLEKVLNDRPPAGEVMGFLTSEDAAAGAAAPPPAFSGCGRCLACTTSEGEACEKMPRALRLEPSPDLLFLTSPQKALLDEILERPRAATPGRLRGPWMRVARALVKQGLAEMTDGVLSPTDKARTAR